MIELKNAIKESVKNLYNEVIDPELTRPEEKFGDYATNVALQLAKIVSQPPREIAEALMGELKKTGLVERVEVAGPGFINVTLSDEALASGAWNATELVAEKRDKQILVEFGDPNPFKEMHVGHLYDAVVGDAIAGLLEKSGAEVIRLSYHGDVGLQVAQWLWAIHKRVGWDTTAAREILTGSSNDTVIGEIYAEGAQAYKNDKQAAAEIQAINLQVYSRENPDINGMYELGRSISLEKFNDMFKSLGIEHQKHYLESQTTPIGMEFVKDNIGKVFEESDGAVVFKGENVGLHTRVFITSKGLPTYETKDLGLAELKSQDYPDASRSIIITASEQTEYFKVMLAALTQIDPKLATKTTHIAHGFLNPSTGKMSSRTGDVYGASRLLEAIKEEVTKQYPGSKTIDDTYMAAVKYNLLKHRLGPDIAFDVKESVGIEGNSGPYLQYAYARAKGIVRKASKPSSQPEGLELEPQERLMVRKLSMYSESIDRAIVELMPHHVTSYLFELAQTFNRFYENNRIVGDDREELRLKIVETYAEVLKDGLKVLGIAAPEEL